MKPSRVEVASMPERDYFAQLICWRRGGSCASEADFMEADNILKNEFRDALRILDARLQYSTSRK